MIRIDRGADLADLWGGQLDFEVSVALYDDAGEFVDFIGAGHTVAEAVADARKTLRRWAHANDCPECGAAESACDCEDMTERDGDGLDEFAQ